MFRTGNPVLKDDTFRGLPREFGAEAMADSSPALFTLVWLYLEMLRLLAKLQDRRR
jgi:hypothetical protein